MCLIFLDRLLLSHTTQNMVLSVLLVLVTLVEGRVVVIGDMHGDIRTTREVLQTAGVLSKGGDEWVGGSIRLVCTGDMVDRGPDGHGIMDLMMSLQQQAAHHGGKVDVLLGNHEVMNVKGDWAFVDPRDTAAHGGRESRQQAYSSTGRYGQFIRSLPLMLVIKDIVFCHGGLLRQWAMMGIDEINSLAAQNMANGEFDAPVLMNDGPVWSRTVITSALRGDCTPLKSALTALSIAEGRQINHMVIGHTAQLNGKMAFLCDNALAAIDVYASSFYEGGGWATFLEINDSEFEWHQVGPVKVPRPSAAAALTMPSKEPFTHFKQAIKRPSNSDTTRPLLLVCSIVLIVLGWYNAIYLKGRRRLLRSSD
eukprot:TRINITY_DN13707_c0_g1_i1.p1 TRINITY_DN13707_c0_g1~~TRINITY_DN13707_c0_g1_i1.p1  ORF type:complete len:366 (+),score=46.68 TRINITY_DN13707_c0_g1_i1:57-1154(+)